MSVRVEVIGVLTTFLTMCYIMAVNPAILSTTGMDKAALFTGTAVAAGVATVFHFLPRSSCSSLLPQRAALW